MNAKPMTRSGGFTLTELLIVVALIGIILALAGPPLADYVRVQRLKGISSELSTDLAFARSEAVSRGTYMQMRVQSGSGLSCYIIYARPDGQASPTCDCTQPAGSRCTGTNIEVKTVVVPQSQQVTVSAVSTNPSGVVGGTYTYVNNVLTINPRTGGVFAPAVSESAIGFAFSVDTALDSARALRTTISQSGMVKTCLAPGATLAGAPSC